MELLYENNKVTINHVTQSELIVSEDEFIMYIYIKINLKGAKHYFKTRTMLTYYKDKNTIFTKYERIQYLGNNYKHIVTNAINNSKYIYNLYSYLFKEIRKLNNE